MSRYLPCIKNQKLLRSAVKHAEKLCFEEYETKSEGHASLCSCRPGSLCFPFQNQGAHPCNQLLLLCDNQCWWPQGQPFIDRHMLDFVVGVILCGTFPPFLLFCSLSRSPPNPSKPLEWVACDPCASYRESQSFPSPGELLPAATEDALQQLRGCLALASSAAGEGRLIPAGLRLELIGVKMSQNVK